MASAFDLDWEALCDADNVTLAQEINRINAHSKARRAIYLQRKHVIYDVVLPTLTLITSVTTIVLSLTLVYMVVELP